MKKFLLFALCLFGGMISSQAQPVEAVYDDPIEATPIESLSTYTGTDPYVFDMGTRKYYAYNNLNEYEECGLYPEVSTLKVAGAGASEITYIKTNTTMGTVPYINLNYIPKANTRVVATVNVAAAGQTGGWKAVFGTGFWGNGWESRLCYFSCAEAGNSALSLKGETKGTPIYDKKVIIDLDNTAGKVLLYDAETNEEITDAAITEVEPWTTFTEPLYVFAQNKKGNIDCYNNSMTLYGMQIYEGETLVMDLVPVVDGEGHGGLKDKVSGTCFYSANDGNFELSEDGQTIAGEAGISVYPGKLVIYTDDSHEYKWNGTAWEDKGSVYKPIAATNYQNMTRDASGEGWYCRWGYEETYGHIENDGNNNFFNPYNGKGDWEPYQCTVTGLTKGETYRVSFDFTSEGWNSWSSYTQIPFFAINTPTFDRTLVPSGVSGAVLGYVGLPQAAMTAQPYSFTFTADGTEVTLVIQFGVGDDNKDFRFHFDNLKIEFVDYPVKYDLSWADPNKYTPLAYIESTGATRANAFTLPYNPKTATQIDAKFNVYDTSDGWCGIFSARNVEAGTGISLYMNGNNKAFFGYFTGGTTGAGDEFAPFSVNTDYVVTADVTKLVVNGETYNTGNSVTNATSRNLSLFANPEKDSPMRGRFYYCTISEDGETIYDFKPVIRHDGVFGFYDKASKTFVLPAKGTLDGYGYQKLDDEVYVTFNNDTRIAIVGSTAQYLPEVDNLDGYTLTWTSADESIATVAADGTVTGVSAGKVIITATTPADGGWTASYELTVSEPTYSRTDADGVGYAIVTGGNGWNDSPLSALLDNDATTKFGCSGTGDAWAIFIASQPVAVKQYTFVTGKDTHNYPARNPRSWKLEGSNDNQTWTLIDEQIECAYKFQFVNQQEFTFAVNGTEEYKYFKFSATAVGNGFQLGEFWINEQAHAFDKDNSISQVAPTCTTEGATIYECTDCHVLCSEPIPATGHMFGDDGICTICGANVNDYEPVLLANGQDKPYAIKFRHMPGSTRKDKNDVDIETGWNTPDFDDSAWDELLMPIGSDGYNEGPYQGARYNTLWFGEDNTYWFRRTFYIDNAFSKLTLKVLHDDSYIVFVNGTQVDANEGWTDGTNWAVIEVDPALLVPGKNVVAMYIEQNFGGAYCDFSLEGSVATVTVGDALYATYVAPANVDFDGAEVSAFAAQKMDTYVHLEPVTNVPAGTAVVLKADAAGTYALKAGTADALTTTNDLVAATDEVAADGTQYVLAKPEGEEIGFYPATTGTIAAGKGYLIIDNGAKAFYPFDTETAIKSVNADTDAVIYNLAGQRLNRAQKGVNIINGKKVLK